MQSRKQIESRAATDDPRSTLTIVREIADDSATLIRKEVELARAEIVEAVNARIKAAGAFAGAGVFAVMGLMMCAIAAAVALATVMSVWAAFLIVAGGLFVLAGGAIVFARMRMSRPSLKPEQTVRTVKEDVEWTKALLKR